MPVNTDNVKETESTLLFSENKSLQPAKKKTEIAEPGDSHLQKMAVM